MKDGECVSGDGVEEGDTEGLNVEEFWDYCS